MSELLNLERELERLEPWQLTAFSAALTERMFPNFTLFARLAEFGDPAGCAGCWMASGRA